MKKKVIAIIILIILLIIPFFIFNEKESNNPILKEESIKKKNNPNTVETVEKSKENKFVYITTNYDNINNYIKEEQVEEERIIYVCINE